MCPLICQLLSPTLASLSPLKPVSSVMATRYQVSVHEKVKGQKLSQEDSGPGAHPSLTPLASTYKATVFLLGETHAQGAAILELNRSFYVTFISCRGILKPSKSSVGPMPCTLADLFMQSRARAKRAEEPPAYEGR